MKRRDFLGTTLASSAAFILSPELWSAHPGADLNLKRVKISLAQWSLHRSFEKGSLKAEDFASIAHDKYRLHAVEYVNAFYKDVATDEKFWKTMKSRADNAGVKSLLIMVDGEGDLGSTSDKTRMKAVQNHIKWLNAASLLGCHSIRVNAFGSGDRNALKSSLTDGLGALAEEGSKRKINVLVENHGLHTSDAGFITDIIKNVDNKFLGTLPDFGNWCLNKEWGSTMGGQCTEIYDPYKGVSEMLPFAKGVSAKSYEFDSDGNETTIDYKKMFELVKASDFNGYIGIEYEGTKLNEDKGIRATKNLIEKAWSQAG